MGLAEMFWGRDRQQALIDVQIFNTFVRSHRNTLLSQSYRKQEMKKKRVYEERIRKVEHGTFSSLVFTTAGGLGPAATVVYERLASGIAEKHNRPMGRCCTSSDADWTSFAEIHHCVSARLPINHTQSSQSLGRGHHQSDKCWRQGPQWWPNNLLTTVHVLLLFFVAFFLTQAVRMCAYAVK